MFNNHSRGKDGKQSWCIVCMNEANRARYREVRDMALQKLGNVCVNCGWSDPRALQIDHIDGGGKIERKTMNNVSLHKKIASGDTDGYQLLCANCNWIKKYEMHEV